MRGGARKLVSGWQWQLCGECSCEQPKVAGHRDGVDLDLGVAQPEGAGVAGSVPRHFMNQPFALRALSVCGSDFWVLPYFARLPEFLLVRMQRDTTATSLLAAAGVAQRSAVTGLLRPNEERCSCIVLRRPESAPVGTHRRVGVQRKPFGDGHPHGNDDREGLERLCRYGSRGPIAECRLRKLSDERYEYTPKRGVTFTLTAKDLECEWSLRSA